MVITSSKPAFPPIDVRLLLAWYDRPENAAAKASLDRMVAALKAAYDEPEQPVSTDG